MIQARERKPVSPFVFAGDRERMTLVIRSVGPLLLNARLEGLIRIGRESAGGVLGAAPGVGDRAGEAVGQDVLHTDLQSVGDHTGARLGGKIADRAAKDIAADLFCRSAVWISIQRSAVARFVTVSSAIPPFPRTELRSWRPKSPRWDPDSVPDWRGSPADCR